MFYIKEFKNPCFISKFFTKLTQYRTPNREEQENLKMNKNKKPQLTNSEAMKEVSNRTGLPFTSVSAAILAYQDIVRECVDLGVEVKMGDLGIMGYSVRNPAYNVVNYNIYTGEKMLPEDKPGYHIPYFRPAKRWKTELRKQTEFWDNEQNGNKGKSD